MGPGQQAAPRRGAVRHRGRRRPVDVLAQDREAVLLRQPHRRRPAGAGGGQPGRRRLPGWRNASKEGPRATVVAVDPATGKEQWRVETQQAAGVAALAVQGRHLYGVTTKGGLFVIDRRTRKVVHSADISSVSKGFAAMVTNRGAVYGVSDTTLYRFHPKTFAVSTVVAGINGAWYSGPHLNVHEGLIYTLRGGNLVAVDDRPAH
ncbi:PQQ-binding-like beta-propeller repeat protein [Streptomyces sp. NPDC087866]|uniref:outer membrane protein assembly factor BamB family protein n=1 Tax=Streptomyces sp. NPDC087866 TaxID=3365815 RepID=UPI003810B5AD